MGGPNERGLFNGHPIEWNKKKFLIVSPDG